MWERLIRSIKRILPAICNEQNLNDESLASALAEVERILNNRPLTPVSDDGPNHNALTPNHLLLMRESTGLDFGSTTNEHYNARWKQVNCIAGEFWKRWTREYLPLLQERQKWFRPKRNFAEGDIVLVANGTNKKTNGPWAEF